MSTRTKISDGDERVAQALACVAESGIGGEAKTAAFVGALISQNYRDYAATTTVLIDSLQHENAELRATLSAVRERVEYLLSGPYMPTPAAILGALWSGPARTGTPEAAQ